MQRISYINQMNGFLARCGEDALPANAVVMYLMLFNCFNRSCWRNTWMRFTIQQLMAFTHVGSPNTVYNMRRLLKELGYIEYRPAKNGVKSQTEYRLLPLGESCANVNGVAGRGAEEGSGTNAINADCAFAGIKCANTECPANEQPNGFSDSECADNEPSNKESKYANNEYSLNENKKELSHTEHSINEHSESEHSESEHSESEHSINASSKSEYSVSENSKNERSESESSCREGAGGFSGEFSKSERQADNSPNREEEKTRNTSHDTSVKYREEVNKNTSINKNTNTGENPAAGKGAGKRISVSEFCRTNGDYLLCADAYRDYFRHEPPSEDKVRLIRFLGMYGAQSTLSAMNVMMQNKANSLEYCEGVLRRMQWKSDRNAVRRPAPRPHSDWQGWRMA